MKRLLSVLLIISVFLLASSCDDQYPSNLSSIEPSESTINELDVSQYLPDLLNRNYVDALNIILQKGGSFYPITEKISGTKTVKEATISIIESDFTNNYDIDIPYDASVIGFEYGESTVGYLLISHEKVIAYSAQNGYINDNSIRNILGSDFLETYGEYNELYVEKISDEEFHLKIIYPYATVFINGFSANSHEQHYLDYIPYPRFVVCSSTQNKENSIEEQFLSLPDGDVPINDFTNIMSGPWIQLSEFLNYTEFGQYFFNDDAFIIDGFPYSMYEGKITKVKKEDNKFVMTVYYADEYDIFYEILPAGEKNYEFIIDGNDIHNAYDYRIHFTNIGSDIEQVYAQIGAVKHKWETLMYE